MVEKTRRQVLAWLLLLFLCSGIENACFLERPLLFSEDAMNITIIDQAVSKSIRIHLLPLLRLICPVLISFLSICLFLFLSFMIIEGYSVLQMMEGEHYSSIVSVQEKR